MEAEASPWFDALDWCASDYLSQPPSVPSGIAPLDSALVGGFRQGVYTVLGRPGEGKSALALAIVERTVSAGVPAAVLSLEMSAADAWLRVASAWSVRHKDQDGCRQFTWSSVWQQSAITVGYGGGRISSGADAIITAARSMAKAKAPLMIAEPEPDLDRVVQLLQASRDAGAALAVVDYLQLIDVPGIEREHERVSVAMRALATTSKELRMPVLLVAAMNREGLTGAATMHSAAGSSLVEYASSCVMTYVRDKDADCAPGTRRMLLNVEKNRNGMVTEEPIGLTYWPGFNWIEECE